MKSTGMTRKIDNLGRIVIPIELRRTLGINLQDALEIFVDGEHVIMRKYRSNEDKLDIMKELDNVFKYSDNPHVHEIINNAKEFIKKG